MTAIQLTDVDLLIGALLLSGSALLSFLLSLDVDRRMVVAGSRMVLQLLLVGYLLRVVFGSGSPTITLLVVTTMLCAASWEAGSRGAQRLGSRWRLGIGALSVASATVPVVLVVLLTALRPTPWYEARHAIPLVGIVLGTVLNAASLSLNGILGGVDRERPAIEAMLAMGLTRYEAMRPLVRRSVFAGTIPTLNQMAAAGIITLPGIMTGQVLAGMDPLASARYQILLMFVLATAGFLGSVVAAAAATARLTDGRHRLRIDRLVGGK